MQILQSCDGACQPDRVPASSSVPAQSGLKLRQKQNPPRPVRGRPGRSGPVSSSVQGTPHRTAPIRSQVPLTGTCPQARGFPQGRPVFISVSSDSPSEGLACKTHVEFLAVTKLYGAFTALN